MIHGIIKHYRATHRHPCLVGQELRIGLGMMVGREFGQQRAMLKYQEAELLEVHGG